MTAPVAGGRIAVIGLGTMGAAMAHRLSDAGAALRLYNRTGERARALAEETGAAVAATPGEAAAGTQAALVCVAEDADLEQVLLGPGGVFTTADGPAVVIAASTVLPATADRVGAHGPLLDAGVVGNVQHARAGELRWYIGGSASLLAIARPVLDCLGKQVIHAGGQGAGMRFKLAMNLLMGLEVQALAEAVALGESSGLDRHELLAAISESGFSSPVMRFKAKRMAAGSYGDPDFRLRLMAKDLTHAVAEAGAKGARLPMAEVAAATHTSAVAAGDGDADCAAVVRAVGRPARGQGR